MRLSLVLLAASACFAQVAARNTVPAASAPVMPTQPKAAPLKIAPSAFVNLERAFDVRLGALADQNGPIDQLGLTRGVYLDGYGVVFMSELALIQTPTINPFNPTITDAQKSRVHSAKLARLPALKKAIAESARSIATSLTQVPETQQIVVAVRLDYLPWETTAGLPGLVIAKADRRSAIAGNIQIEEQ